MNDAPPAEERLTALDLIRGVAVLGVLLANLPHFCGPETPRHRLPPADRAVAAVTQYVVDAKFISMLAVLFGAGLAIQFLRARAAGRPFAKAYLWRQFLLYLLGLSHVVFLWFGDILAVYAAVSVVVLGVVLLGPTWEKAVLIAALVWAYFLLAVSFVALLVFGPMLMAMVERNAKEIGTDEPPLTVFSGDLEGYMSPDNSVRIYRHGTFLDQAGHRLLMHLLPFFTAMPLAFGWYLVALFLIGVQLIRVGAFDPATRPPWLFPLMLSLGAGVGLPLHAAAVTWGLLDPKAPWPGLLHLVGVLPQALMYLALLTLWNESRFLVGLQERLRAVGRMALTNYLVQSLIATFVFDNWGLNLYARTGLFGGLVVVFGVWALELLWSRPWLSAFRMGPVEWLWRSAVALRVLPMRVKPEVAVWPR